MLASNNKKLNKKIMRNKWITILGAFLLGVTIFACKKSFLERPPQGNFSELSLANAKGINATVIAAYALLDGWSDNGWNNAAGNPWPAAGSNWVFGSVTSDDAYPGSQPNDQPSVEAMNRFEFLPDDPYFRAKFQTCYAGVGKANVAIRLINAASSLSAADKKQLNGEAKFLRAHYHFDAYKMFINIPFIDEKVTEYRQPNTTDIFPKIEADFKEAIADLAEVSSASSGRASKGAAQAYLAKAYMFIGKYAEAKPLLAAVISSNKYSLVANFHDNFDASKQNNSEMIFAYKASVNDGANESANGNWGDRLNFPHGNAPVTQCCGFHQPSQNLVNAFKTDAAGLPLFATFNDANFNPATDNVDPRLDWTAGRTDYPFYDWGVQKNDWVRDGGYCGFFTGKKNVFHNAQKGTLSTASGWSNAPNAIDIPFIRYADVLLMAAECEIETSGDLNLARTYINQVRDRAGKFVQGAGTSEATISAPLTAGAGTVNGTIYKVGQYTAPFANQAAARQAVRWERRLELAMEGGRYFDLRRWNDLQTLVNFLTVEKTRRTQLYAAASQPTATKLKYFPIPSIEIDLSKIDGVAQLKQNTGY
jgi:starch-binding outer membrane protein, SusD/RagB family